MRLILFLGEQTLQFPEAFDLLLMPFLFVVIDELSKFDLQRIHDLIPFLNLAERFLLVGLHEDLDQRLHLLVLPLFLHPILSQFLQVIFDPVPQINPIIFHQFCIGGDILVHSSMMVIVSLKKGISSW